MSALNVNSYVHRMLDDNQDIQEYILSNSRRMGALVTMRDDPMDAPIPRQFKIDDYYLNQIKKLTCELFLLEFMTNDQKIAKGEELKTEAEFSDVKNYEERQAELAKVKEMYNKILQWAPPTELVNLREIILRDLTEALNSNKLSYSKPTPSASDKSPMDFYTGYVQKISRELEYAKKSYEEELIRVAERNVWLDILWSSLPKS